MQRKTWARKWYVQTSEGASVDVKMGFDFAAAGLTTPGSADGYAVWYSEDGATYSAIDAAGTLDGDVMTFTLPAVANGYYALSVGVVSSNRSFNSLDEAVNLYPNPTTNEANIVINNSENGKFSISVYNMTGSLVKQIVSNKAAGSHIEHFSVADFTTGVYLIEVTQGNKRAIKRLIKK